VLAVGKVRGAWRAALPAPSSSATPALDDSLAPVWAKLTGEGLAGMTMLGRHLLDTGQLRDGIGLGEVRDVLWNYLAIDHYERLVLTQGWPLERYSRWLTHAITRALCP